MTNNIYTKLSKMREAIKKPKYNSFAELVEVVSKKAKYYKVLPLYCFYDGMAALTIVDMDEIESKVVFKIPVELVDVKNAKEKLYHMAFDIEETDWSGITQEQYLTLCAKMAEVNVTEDEIVKRYKIVNLKNMPYEIYERCMSALEKTSKGQQ